MKFGNKMEGSPEEIRDFFQNNGLNITDYMERPDLPLKAVWFILPVCFIVVSLTCLTFLMPLGTSMQTFVFLLGCGAGIWLAVNVQLRFKNTWAAVFVAIGTILLILVAIGTVTPTEMIQQLNKFKN
ncbi:MAG: hypothetical protein NTY86_03005 [Deltaproteobacteria bacterium]|nr:hypothetical protein [Deltaproteobacteria bacterium]